MEKREEKTNYKAHCLVFPFPIQGHINPMLQFAKSLVHKGLKVTLVTTRHVHKTMPTQSSSSSSTSIAVEAISDGHDEGERNEAESQEAYLDRFREIGTKTLIELLDKLLGLGNPVDCIVYDSFLNWPLVVAKKFGIFGAVFFTQSCAVDNIYYHVHHGHIKLPLPLDSEILIPGLPPLKPSEMPSFIVDTGAYQALFKIVVNDQFSNVFEADLVFCNTFYELEEEVVNWMKNLWPLRTIGPTIPSMYLDKRRQDDKEYGFSLFNPNNDACINWLNTKPKRSVAYVSFGSLAALGAEQMEELGFGLIRCNCFFLWVVRETEKSKLPKGFVEETSEKGLVVSWCPQLEVLAHEAVGCFFTHCGWNSTLEALSLGVPMVAMPQWTDQRTNAKYIMDVWKMGLRVKADEKGMVRQETIESCVREILEGEKGKEIQKNAFKWKELAKTAVDEGGSSDKNIDEFIAKLVQKNKIV